MEFMPFISRFVGALYTVESSQGMFHIHTLCWRTFFLDRRFSSTSGFDLPSNIMNRLMIEHSDGQDCPNLLGDSPTEPTTDNEITNLVIPSHRVATKKCPRTPFIIQAAY